jgi:hypothetical protein
MPDAGPFSFFPPTELRDAEPAKRYTPSLPRLIEIRGRPASLRWGVVRPFLGHDSLPPPDTAATTFRGQSTCVCAVCFGFVGQGLPLLTICSSLHRCDDRGTVGPVTHSFSHGFSLSFDRDDADDVASSPVRSRYTNMLRCHPLGHTHILSPCQWTQT